MCYNYNITTQQVLPYMLRQRPEKKKSPIERISYLSNATLQKYLLSPQLNTPFEIARKIMSHGYLALCRSRKSLSKVALGCAKDRKQACKNSFYNKKITFKISNVLQPGSWNRGWK